MASSLGGGWNGPTILGFVTFFGAMSKIVLNNDDGITIFNYYKQCKWSNVDIGQKDGNKTVIDDSYSVEGVCGNVHTL